VIPVNENNSSVLFNSLGSHIVSVVLNKPKSLNSLDLGMIRLINGKIE
jgi:enoyl-CoA hydratase/carnithine racemase